MFTCWRMIFFSHAEVTPGRRVTARGLSVETGADHVFPAPSVTVIGDVGRGGDGLVGGDLDGELLVARQTSP